MGIILKILEILCVLGMIYFAFLLSSKKDRLLKQYGEEDEFVTSRLNSLSFGEVSFIYKILSIYWDKDRASTGRRLALERMLKTANTSEEWREIYEMTPEWDPEIHKKSKEKLQELGG